jgi:aminopeptidase N
MRTDTPKTIRLKDYRPPEFLIDTVFLNVSLGEDHTVVEAMLEIRRNPESDDLDAPLVLDGENLETVRVALGGSELTEDEYTISENRLRIEDVPDNFSLETTVHIRPQDNTRLEGLYKSGDIFCTQCEAEGFRHITWYFDRPDVLARFRTRIEADRETFPVLLSNGNCIASGELPPDLTGDPDSGRHFAVWEDPHPKPCYLFALVAGDLGCLEDGFTTASGREVALKLYVEHGKEDRARHAMESLKKAMKWDEDVFGLEYDLDIYMIVAVSAFNMGAMENKGLNLFNDKLVFADPDTATDTDYAMIEAVIAHEYFHNWTGNRITCRDWFQLSLKEGLTVFRDQQFSADMRSAAEQRIADVRALRARQFPEDSGPLAHPVRPDSYIEINNFYTATVYEKGAEVIRMMHTLLGPEGFRKGMDLYFERHDGQAVTCDDFAAAMWDANPKVAETTDLGLFKRWYAQAGTPAVTAKGDYDAAARRYTLTLAQETKPTPGQPDKLPLVIPIALGLLGQDGEDIPLNDGATTEVIHLTEAAQSFTFENIPEAPVPSILRGFSAPVRLTVEGEDAGALAFRMAHDSDAFNRWEAAQRFARLIVDAALKESNATPALTAATALADTEADPALIGDMLALPSESDLAEQQEVVDVDAIHAARESLKRAVAEALEAPLAARYDALRVEGPYDHGPAQSGKRRLANLALSYLTSLGTEEAFARAKTRFEAATNMTDSIGALSAVNDCDTPIRAELLDAFYARWQGDALVTDKWFTMQAVSSRADTLDRVKELMGHPDFSMKTPNRVRALIGAFTSANPLRFHSPDGSGYDFLSDRVVELNALNPQVAARMLGPLARWRRFDEARQAKMKQALERILATPDLSKDVFEIASKALG